MKGLVCLRVLAFVLVMLLPARCAPPPEESVSTKGAMFGGNPQHTGVHDTDAVHRSPRVQWIFETDGPVRSSPGVANGAVYFGGGDGFAYAVDAETGKEKWRFKTEGAVHGSPAVADGTVFFPSKDGNLYALDEGTGQLNWTFTAGEDLPFEWGWDYYLSSPTVVEGVVYFGSGDGHLYAADAETGTERWRFETGGRVRSSPAVFGDVVHVGSMDGNLYAVSRETGELVWKFETEGSSIDSTAAGFDRTSIQSSPAILDGVITFGSRDGHLYALDQQTGKQNWRFDHEVSWVISTPALFDGMVLAGSSDGHFFHAVDLSTGEEKWRYEVSQRIFSSGAVADGIVYFGCFDGHLFALDARTSEEKWRFKTGDSVMSTPAVADGTVYFGSDDGTLYAVTGTTSAEPGQRRPEKAVYWQEHDGWRWYQGGEETRDYFDAAGYEVVDDIGLTEFLRDRITDRAPSVVVSTMDTLPSETVSETSEPGLARQYLDAGGKIVWLGFAPFTLVMDPETKQPKGVDHSIPDRILDVDHEGVDFSKYGSTATAKGLQWGLPRWWVGSMAIRPEEATIVLGLDENGKASAWVKSYGGPEGTGFVRLWGRQDLISDLAALQAVAEYGLR